MHTVHGAGELCPVGVCPAGAVEVRDGRPACHEPIDARLAGAHRHAAARHGGGVRGHAAGGLQHGPGLGPGCPARQRLGCGALGCGRQRGPRLRRALPLPLPGSRRQRLLRQHVREYGDRRAWQRRRAPRRRGTSRRWGMARPVSERARVPGSQVQGQRPPQAQAPVGREQGRRLQCIFGVQGALVRRQGPGPQASVASGLDAREPADEGDRQDQGARWSEG
mmetsp:Transcript_111254/g.314922  ORF Transcript_111254/g.314922 Transcript_111254/m.314922 type:complete len:222 (+) Transcript_111254:163-828(+)